MAAKSIAEVNCVLDALAARVNGLSEDAGALASADERLADHIRTGREEAVKAREELAFVRKLFDEERALGRDRDRLIAELRQESALLRQRFDDHRKGVETWSGRLWTLVTILVGALIGAVLTSFRK